MEESENNVIDTDKYHGKPKIILFDKNNLRVEWGNSSYGNTNFGLRNKMARV